MTCQTNINDCPPSNCSGNGVCIDGINSYTCNCSGRKILLFYLRFDSLKIFYLAGWVGQDCQVNINECQSSPCKRYAYLLKKKTI